jgi:FAD synthetase
VNDENTRLEVISSIRYVDQAFLGDEIDYLKSVERVRPDLIVLGPDQFVDENILAKSLESRGLKDIRIVRFKEKLGGHSTSSIIKKILESRCRC